MTSPVERIAGLIVGAIESVAPDRISVVLSADAPQATALNTGVPYGFPRLNSYVLIPSEAGALVGLIVFLGIERSLYPKQGSSIDPGLVDLPFPVRKMVVTPLGMLVSRHLEGEAEARLVLERGVSAFPSVGDPVLLPSAVQNKAIVEGQGNDQRVTIGSSPVARGARVSVDPDKMFGRHLAVLGNTGSGKSCSVAGLVRWSIESARACRKQGDPQQPVNGRFVILDPNGEYGDAFNDLPAGVRVFRVGGGEGADPLVAPGWIWNSSEWSAFASASAQTQRPMLLQALRDLRAGMQLQEQPVKTALRVLNGRMRMFEGFLAGGPLAYSGAFQVKMSVGGTLLALASELDTLTEKALDPEIIGAVEQAREVVQAVIDRRSFAYANGPNGLGFNDFALVDLEEAVAAIVSIRESLPIEDAAIVASEDAPIPFDVHELADHLDSVAAETGGGAVGQFVSYLTLRIRMMLQDQRLGPIVAPPEDPSFEDWIGGKLGSGGGQDAEIVVLDLSLVPTEVLHIVIAVVGRIVFESLQRYKKLNDCELPTVLVLEEAHTFVRRHSGPGEQDHVSPARMCRETFERIAREGRKFGLGLVLSSQRPSELSPTVLSQCNTFLLHRIVNDADQDLVSRLVPDNLGGLLQELPSLPTRHAMLLGLATSIPLLVEMRELLPEQRPKSADPKFWAVWTGEEERVVNWKPVVEDWTGGT